MLVCCQIYVESFIGQSLACVKSMYSVEWESSIRALSVGSLRAHSDPGVNARWRSLATGSLL